MKPAPPVTRSRLPGTQNLPNRANHVVDVLVGELGGERQAHGSLADVVAMGLIFRTPPEALLIDRMGRHALVVDPDSDVLPGHRGEEFVAALARPLPIDE